MLDAIDGEPERMGRPSFQAAGAAAAGNCERSVLPP